LDIPAAKLDVIGGNDEGRAYELTAQQAMIGRGAQSDFVLADLAVSRQHVAVLFDNGRYILTDQGSGNGTKVNGVRITTHVLSDGDIIELGKTKIRFVCPEAASALASPGGQQAPSSARQVPSSAPPVQTGAPVSQPVPARPHPAPQQPNQQDVRGARPPGPEGMAPTLQVDPRPAGIVPQPDISPPTGSVMPPVAKKGGLFGLVARLTDTKLKKVLVFSTLGILAVLMIFAMVKKLKKPPQKAPQVAEPQGPTKEQLYEQGKQLVKEQKWDEAERLYLELAAAEPENPFIKSKLQEIRKNQKARDDYERAEKAFKEGKYGAAKVLAGVVPKETQAYFVKAQGILRKIAEEKAKKLLKEASELKDDKKTKDQAIEKVKEALKEAPNFRPALVMRHELGFGPEPPPLTEEEKAAQEEADATDKEDEEDETEVADTSKSEQSASSTRPSRRSSTSSGGFVGGSEKKFMGFYKARNWSAAAAELNRMAGTGNTRRAKRLRARAAKVKAVGANLSKGDSNRMSNSVAAMNAYKKALNLDKSAGNGAHGSYIKGRLAKVAQAAAGSAFSSGRYAQAYRAAKTAKAYGGDSAVVRRIMDQLSGKAKDVFNKGYVIRDNNLSGAKKHWRQVLKMVPPSNKWYKKAKWFIGNYAKSKRSGGTSAEDEL